MANSTLPVQVDEDGTVWLIFKAESGPHGLLNADVLLEGKYGQIFYRAVSVWIKEQQDKRT